MSCPIESSHNTRKTSKADSKRSSRIIISSHSSPKQFHHSNVEIERRRPSRPTQYYRQFRPTPRPKSNPTPIAIPSPDPSPSPHSSEAEGTISRSEDPSQNIRTGQHSLQSLSNPPCRPRDMSRFVPRSPLSLPPPPLALRQR